MNPRLLAQAVRRANGHHPAACFGNGEGETSRDSPTAREPCEIDSIRVDRQAAARVIQDVERDPGPNGEGDVVSRAIGAGENHVAITADVLEVAPARRAVSRGDTHDKG